MINDTFCFYKQAILKFNISPINKQEMTIIKSCIERSRNADFECTHQQCFGNASAPLSIPLNKRSGNNNFVILTPERCVAIQKMLLDCFHESVLSEAEGFAMTLKNSCSCLTLAMVVLKTRGCNPLLQLYYASLKSRILKSI